MAKEVEIPDGDELFRTYKIKLQARNRVCGYMSPEQEQVEKALERRGVDEDDIEELAEKITKGMDVSDEVEDEDIENVLTFEQDDNGYYMCERHVKGLLKEVSNMLYLTRERRGFKGFINHAISATDKIYFKKDGDYVEEVDGVNRRTGNVSGPQGTRAIVKLVEYIEEPVMEFELKVMDSQKREKLEFDDETLARIFKAGEEQGLLGDRNLGEGKYDLISIERKE